MVPDQTSNCFGMKINFGTNNGVIIVLFFQTKNGAYAAFVDIAFDLVTPCPD